MSTIEFATATHQSSTHATTTTTPSLRDTVKLSVQNYLAHLDGQKVTDFYDMVLSEIEEPLLQSIMQYTGQNQSKAAVYLGLSRGTLRKKLERYGMLICGSSRTND
jgi:Fis family transcriptional regulator